MSSESDGGIPLLTRQEADDPFDPAQLIEVPGPKPNIAPHVWRVLLGVAFLVVLAASGVYAFTITFGQFSFYDDEGYLMLTVQGFLEGNPLYDRVASFYGPVYYFYQWVIHGALAMPLTHDVTRVFTVVHWLLAAGILAVASWQFTRSPFVTMLVFMQGVLHLRTLSKEPGHPQEVVVILFALAVLVAAKGANRQWGLPLLGAIGVALAFTKVNVGGFYGFALMLALSCHSSFLRSHRGLVLVAVTTTATVPFILMRGDLGESWAQHYSLQSCLSLLATGLAALAFAGPLIIERKRWLHTAASVAAMGSFVIGILLFSGSSITATLDSLILEPARMGGCFSVPLHVEGYTQSAVAAIVAASLCLALKTRLPQWGLAIATLKCLYGFLGVWVFVSDPIAQLGYLLPWVWLILLPASSQLQPGHTNGFARVLLCLLAAWQGLQAYPVAGSQVAIGTILAILVYSVCLHDGISVLVKAFVKRLPALSVQCPQAGLLSQALFVIILLNVFISQWARPMARWRYYSSGHAVNLLGARWIQTYPFQANNYRMLTSRLESGCDTFISVPGLNSLYFWTGKKPPAYIALGGQGVMASEAQQVRAVAGIRSARQPLVVLFENSWPGEVRLKERDGPLLRFIRDECQQIDSIGPYRILAPKSRTKISLPNTNDAASS